ncbi:MAG: DUF6241 domain-containing protein [Bacillus sp. (in: Bacteria)]|nr:DUF6241 domain-containing protein [Bacillus sp. (in: firmicutes)]
MEERGLEGRNYIHENLYRQILRDWQNDNYTNSVKYHDELRRLRGMITISRATAVFTPEQVEQFKQDGYPLPQGQE